MFRNLEEKMQIYICDLDIEIDGQLQQRRMQAPRIMLENEFISLVEQASNSNLPIKIKISTKIPMFNEFTEEWFEREGSITFINNVYIGKNGEMQP